MTRSRTAILAGNWKMNYGPIEAKHFAEEMVPELAQVLQGNTDVLSILCPPTISLSAVRAVLDALPSSQINNLELGAQNMYFEEHGAFTGEVSPLMVRELCSSVILGHSERRMYFCETNELVNKKVLSALEHGLRPIVCVGENEEQHNTSQTEEIISTQISACLCNIPGEHLRDVVVAYEPIWAIGSGKAATDDDAGKVTTLIRRLYRDMYDEESANALHILYGGSVTSENIEEYMTHPDIDGVLIGGASIKTDFVKIVSSVIKHS